MEQERAHRADVQAVHPSTNGEAGAMAPPALMPARASSGPAWVYALGRIEARFPTLSVEKEFAQATGRADTAGLTDRQSLQAVIAKRENRYLARLLCWVLTIEGTRYLHPRATLPGRS